MLCDRCQKNPASIRLTKIINGNKTEMNLCQNCAAESEKNYIEPEVSFQNFLSGLLDIASKQPEQLTTRTILACKRCNTTYQNFKKTGKFGCSDCYKTFGLFLPQIFRRIHGNNSHTGKIPIKTQGKLVLKRTIINLKDELKKAVEHENFEEAAKIRDEIRDMERGEATP